MMDNVWALGVKGGNQELCIAYIMNESHLFTISITDARNVI